jgi:hypothetical protein
MRRAHYRETVWGTACKMSVNRVYATHDVREVNCKRCLNKMKPETIVHRKTMINFFPPVRAPELVYKTEEGHLIEVPFRVPERYGRHNTHTERMAFIRRFCDDTLGSEVRIIHG